MSHFCFIPCLILGDCNFRNPVLHPLQPSASSSRAGRILWVPVGWLHTLSVICAAQVLLIIHENFGQLVSQLNGTYACTVQKRRALNAIWKAAASRRAAARLFSSSPWDDAGGIKQTTISKSIYFCSERNELRGTSESTKPTTTVSGLDG